MRNKHGMKCYVGSIAHIRPYCLHLTIKAGSIMHLVVRYFDSSVHMAMLLPASPLLPKPQRPGSAANTGQPDPNEPRDPGYWQSEEGKASAERARPKINLTS